MRKGYACGCVRWRRVQRLRLRKPRAGAATYQAIPTLIDVQLGMHGAKPMYRRGAGDVRGDFDSDYRAWYGGLWPSVAAARTCPEALPRR